ncbi:hypothetical protein B2G71_22355 [Novosphingobium sp. PC22D]|uniref:lasso peptide biosynthesis B2 protein n=1 Tax=Novosphingobium sp. PC22D TaxID=1962403 RepID=UPI000BF059AD|nr:lasso peptide biosynthesis B2 protein [Novosphingobium sp. PC22D]PEQ10429.1 hypothetical protein B2G71_22355 [Novosphingobium sp. PC22D]
MPPGGTGLPAGGDALVLDLAEGIGVAAFEGKVVVLDIRQDRYRAYCGELAAGLRQIASGDHQHLDPRVIERLLRLGLVSRGKYLHLRKPINTLPPVEASALEGQDGGTAAKREIVRTFLVCRRIRRDLRRKPLHEVLSRLPENGALSDPAKLTDFARTFDKAMRPLPFRPRCLPDTLAFAHLARRGGFEIDIVFGVKLEPFEAHSWAQAGSCVLTDPLEKVRRFTPIFAL